MPRVLTTRQHNAIPLILLGQSDDQVARAIGVCRESVCKWRNHHPQFIAELDRLRAVFFAPTTDRYQRSLNQALDAFGHCQSSPHVSHRQKLAAASILIRTAARQSLARENAGSTDVEQIRRQVLAAGIEPCPDDDSPENDADVPRTTEPPGESESCPG